MAGPNRLNNVSKKLVTALNSRGYKLLFANKQFIGKEGDIHVLFTINQAVYDEEKEKWINKELYSSGSMVRIVLFLRDLWYAENGQPLPTDQEQWNIIRQDLLEKGVFKKWAVQDTAGTDQE